MRPVRTQPLFTLQMSLHPIQDLGGTPLGARKIIPVEAGSFEGERLKGIVLPHTGSDWLLLRADGSFQSDVRLVLQTDDGALISMTYRGVRCGSAEVTARLARGEPVSPNEYYLRMVPFFETSAPRYAWLNGIVAVGQGERLPQGVIYEVHEVL